MERRSFLLGCSVLGSLSLSGLPGLAQPSPARASGSPLCQGWETFAGAFLQPDGRIVDTGNQGITHTEALGVAMLAAQACNDRPRFDKIWTFAQQLRRPDGLFSWKWVPGKGIADVNNATDGDLYIAWALCRAGQRWNDRALLAAAGQLAQAVRNNCQVQAPAGHVLLPGTQGFIVKSAMGVERAVVNPSYFVFPAFRDLAQVDPSPVWETLFKDGLTVIDASRNGPLGLPADWVLLDDPVTPWRDRPARFGYEAIRIPLFLTWAQRTNHPALRACARYLQQPGFPAWVALDGSEKAAYAAPVGFEAIARLTRKAVYGMPVSLPAVSGDYFSSSLVLLSLLAATDLGWA